MNKMSLQKSIQNFGIKQALKYMEKDPERKMLGELLRIIGQLAAAKRRSETLAGRIGADEDNGKLM